MNKLIFTFILSFLSFSLLSQKKKIVYDFTCMESSATNWLSDMEKNLIDSYGSEVSLMEEKELGQTLLTECKIEYKFIESGSELHNLKKILKSLKAQIKNPKGFDYEIYYIDDKTINAFTAGGKIFFTSGMYKFCLDKNEIASIIGHEISHNELGHIKQNISKAKTYDYYLGKEFGEWTLLISNLLTMSFNQKNETHCDLVGIDLAQGAGYQSCNAVSLWKRMQIKDGPESDLNFLSTHPYSGRRAECARFHLQKNYSINCVEN
jgi:predicted Zn-dependent protease